MRRRQLVARVTELEARVAELEDKVRHMDQVQVALYLAMTKIEQLAARLADRG